VRAQFTRHPKARRATAASATAAFAAVALGLLLFAPVALAAPSTATTEPADTVHHTDAVLHGHLDPGTETVTACHFEWGTDTNYTGGTIPCDQGQSYSTAADVSATLGNLTPEVTYHYQLVLTASSSGTVLGGDRTVEPFAFGTRHDELAHFGPDGTSSSTFSSQLGSLAFRQGPRSLFALFSSEVRGFDASSPLSFPPLSGFDPLTLSPPTNGGAPAIDNATGNIYYTKGHPENEGQKVTVDATAGTFKLTFDGSTTPDLPYNTSADDVKSALNALPSLAGVGGRVAIGAGPPNFDYYNIGFSGNLSATDVPQITVSDGATPLSGGSGASAVTTNQGVPAEIVGFDSSGAPLGGNFPIDPTAGPPRPLGGYLTRVAVDPSGDVWAFDDDLGAPSVGTGYLVEYDSSGTFVRTLDLSSLLAQKDPGQIAFDTNGDLYLSSIYSGGGLPTEGVWRFAAPTYTDVTKVSNLAGNAVAVDPSNHHVFLTPRSPMADAEGNLSYEAREYDPRGNLLSEFARGILSPANGAFQGLAVDGANHYVYISDPSNGTIRVFGPDIPVELPTVTAEPPTDLSGHGAILNAKVDPETHQVTDCHFDWVADAQFQADRFASASTAPCSPDPGSGSGDITVSAGLGLEPGTTYHFRIVAANANGAVKGPEQSFTTLGPRVSSPSASQIEDTSATLNAEVNPAGESTTYHFEFGDQGPCDSNPCQSVPVPEASAGSGSSSVAASGQISNLSPDTTYHFRLAATNPDATSYTPDATFTTYPGSPSFGPCPNDQFRTGASARLPDCRAYEQASPVDKNGNDIVLTEQGTQASSAGGGITFTTSGALPGASGSQEWPLYLATRGATAWSTQGLLPPSAFGGAANVIGWTPDLAYSFSDVGNTSPFQLLSRRSSDASITPIANVTYPDLLFAAVSSGDSHVLFESDQQLTPDAPAGRTNLYLFAPATGALSLAGVLPESSCASPPCVPAGGSFAGPYDWWHGTTPAGLKRGGASRNYFTQELHTISSNGDRAFFTAADGAGQVYLRSGLNGPSPETVQISASQRGTPDPNGAKPAEFMGATPSGSRAFFASCAKLTDDSTAVSTAANRCDTSSQGQDLYRWLAPGGGCQLAEGCLDDIAVDGDDPLGAQVQGVLGVGDSGDDVYFVANGVLAGNTGAHGATATPGNCQIAASGEASYTGSCNLYHWHDGAATFVARLDASGGGRNGDAMDWAPNPEIGSGFRTVPTGAVSADGQSVLFRSQLPLTAYDNRKVPEFYRFHSGDPLRCVTCNPTGAAPVGDPGLRSAVSAQILSGGQTFGHWFTRNFSSDGSKFFFETPDKLAAADVNGDLACPLVHFGQGDGKGPACRDVYEWEAPGSGSCSQASAAYSAQDGGCIYLLSTGTNPEPTFFADASASGDDVFLLTRDALVPADGDQLADVYDARTGGGLASQHEIPAPPCDVNAGACEGPGTVPPSAAGAGSGAFQGPGNPPVKRGCPKGKTRRHGRCVRRHPRKHKHHAKHSRRAGR
jgi:hypothetical protein